MSAGDIEIQADMEEVEIESVPVDMPVDPYDSQSVITFQQLPGREDVIFLPQEVIVGDDSDIQNSYDIPVISSKPETSLSSSKPAKKPRRRREDEPSTHKWEQRQVQIKTLEGEFSVTMWSSGADDGESDNQSMPIICQLAHQFIVWLCICELMAPSCVLF